MTNTSQKQHAVLGASNCEKWWQCPGSPYAEMASPVAPPNRYAAEGIVAHTVLEEALQGRAHLIGDVIEQDGYQITVDNEMWESVCVMRDYVDELKQRYKLRPEHILIEKEVALPGNDLDGSPRFGRLDAAVHVPFIALHVIDFKYGKGTEVDVAENKQLLNYAVGVWDSLSEIVKSEIPVIYLTVIQPRKPVGNPVSVYAVVPARMDTFRHELLASIASVTPDAPLRPGDHCQKYFCSARSTCPALRAEVVNTYPPVPLEKTGVIPAVKQLTPQEKADILNKKSWAMSWFEAIENELVNDIEMGATVAGYEVVDKYGRLAWNDEDGFNKVIQPMYGNQAYEEMHEPSTLKTPTQVKNVLKKYKIDIDVSPYTTKSYIGRGLAKVKNGTVDAVEVNYNIE